MRLKLFLKDVFETGLLDSLKDIQVHRTAPVGEGVTECLGDVGDVE
jgi:hypothetical protein